ncbi:hypothetical protein IFM89_002334 [Coptis chinensis]|uniref:ASCH domain-containing protein n=1 Tax=Coptis chinensis TaxID=261450 RepID=A0A835M9D6_9MAGN|nr:hypothetical protein IFM89_002334 [Coptis chinensis]
MEEASQPSSPGVSPVKLSDCMEHLLHLILSSSLNDTLEIDLGLSKSYCSNLLIPDPAHSTNFNVSDGLVGVPPYPLYTRLASALHHCISSGTFVRTSHAVVPFEEDGLLEERKDGWNKLILDKGNELVNMLKAVKFQLHVQEPFFSQLKAGVKTIEGRCAVGDYERIQSGDLLLFNKCLLLEVQDVERYTSFSAMLEAKSLERVLPGIKTIEQGRTPKPCSSYPSQIPMSVYLFSGAQIYHNFYAEEKEKLNGVVAICVTKLVSQPYITVANIVSGLSYEGIANLLGLVHTVGTVGDALPPPISALLSSFLIPHKATVRGSSALSEGARALAKHVNRASNGWWGSFDGNDSNKNRLALGVISHLVTHSSWINIHYIQPDGCILEIRVAEGYGARWSKDGSKFIGFVEPHMTDGHLKRWMH